MSDEITMPGGGTFPRYCWAARLVGQTESAQWWDNEHDFMVVDKDVRQCRRCLAALRVPADIEAFTKAVYGR